MTDSSRERVAPPPTRVPAPPGPRPAVTLRAVSVEADPGDVDLLEEQTGLLLAAARTLDDEGLRAPSLLPGWSRAHVLAHLARNADALVDLVATLEGTPTPMYASRAARDEDIERSARQGRDALLDDLERSCAVLQERLAGMGPAALAARAETPLFAVTGAQVPTLRLREVCYHHADLGLDQDLSDVPADLARRLLAEEVDRLRAHPHAPALTIRTNEHDVLSVGDGRPVVSGPRAGVLAWLTRGDTRGIDAPAPHYLPTLPDLEAPAR